MISTIMTFNFFAILPRYDGDELDDEMLFKRQTLHSTILLFTYHVQ